MRRLIWLGLALGVLAGTTGASGAAIGGRAVLPEPPCGGMVTSERGSLERGPYNETYDGTANHGTGQCAGAPTNC